MRGIACGVLTIQFIFSCCCRKWQNMYVWQISSSCQRFMVSQISSLAQRRTSKLAWSKRHYTCMSCTFDYFTTSAVFGWQCVDKFLERVFCLRKIKRLRPILCRSMKMDTCPKTLMVGRISNFQEFYNILKCDIM